ncbi:hypothetical protein SAMN05421736_10758 [Evansella caseinilytica]|uniref:Uncharacterized protein n=1 Tax=Evansella caseinilytica TaxID=1503961 RepID=A0A1H3QUG8_9BACI|nr:hypothetical protein SAMN05421736_10758 [Evansella caseinilytica]
MLVISSFEQTVLLEVAIANLEMNGISKEQILIAPFDKRREEIKLFDTIQRSDGISLLDLAAVLATIFAVLGASYGFILKWGPIIWGLIGFLFGSLLGYAIDYVLTKKKTKRQSKDPRVATEVVMIVECDPAQGSKVEEILWSNLALGVTRIDSN